MVETLLKIERDPSTAKATAISYGQNRVPIEIGGRPLVTTVQGVNIVGAIEPTLHSLKLADGSQAIYDFAVDNEKQPTLDVSGKSSRSFTWDAATGRILKDGPLSYKITPGKKDYLNAAIEQLDASGATKFWHRDNESGIETMREGQAETIIKWFVSGALNGRTRSYEKEVNGKTEHSILYSYDNLGELFRKKSIDGKTEFFERKDGKLARSHVDQNGKIISEKIYGPDGKLRQDIVLGKVQLVNLYPENGTWSADSQSLLVQVSKYVNTEKVAKITTYMSSSGKPSGYSMTNEFGKQIASLSTTGSVSYTALGQDGKSYSKFIDGKLVSSRVEKPELAQLEEVFYNSDETPIARNITTWRDDRTRVTDFETSGGKKIQEIVRFDEKQRPISIENASKIITYGYDSNGKRTKTTKEKIPKPESKNEN